MKGSVRCVKIKEEGACVLGQSNRVWTVLTSECTFLTPPTCQSARQRERERKTSAFNCKQTTPNLLLPDSLLLPPSLYKKG